MSQRIACAEYEGWLLDSLAAPDATGAPPAAVAEHERSCPACRTSASEMRAGWETFAKLPPIAPPPELQSRVRGAVLAILDDERAAARSPSWVDVAQVPLAVASGLLVAAATLLLLSGLIWGGSLPAGHLFFCAAIFTGLLVGAFSWIYSATTVNGVHLDGAARIGVLALAVTVAGTTACPEFHVLAWWDRSLLGRAFTSLLGEGGSSLVFGVAYGLVPGFLGALFGGRLLHERPVANGLVAAVVVFLLALPVMYLQSAPFTSGVIAIWAAGAALGTLCGVFGALRVRERVASSALA